MRTATVISRRLRGLNGCAVAFPEGGEMDYVHLGRTGLKVSRICLGCMSYAVNERT